tara:strand:+ start:987 stop:1349 length:363 start_codon:yes stop_codon:yes gene_type:complete
MAFSRGYNLLKMVDEFGEPLTLRKVSNAGTYNPTTGTVTGSSTTDHTFNGYFYNYDQGIIADFDQVRRSNRKCVIPALGLAAEPDDEDQIIGSGDTVNIVSVVTIFSNGTKICFLCDVRE